SCTRQFGIGWAFLQRFPRENKLDRQPLAILPTPLLRLDRLGRALGLDTLYVKRDDQTGLGLGGNKVRKLEFLLGDALRQGADTVLTVGALQSNHARQTAAACAQLGLHCELILLRGRKGGEAYLKSGNVLLDRLFGACVQVIDAPASREEAMLERAEFLRKEGRRPYLIPVGGSSLVGGFGYALCAEELAIQEAQVGVRFDTVIVPTGSGGTQAGLVAGLHCVGSKARVLGIAVEGTRAEKEGSVWAQAQELVAALGGRRLPRSAVRVDDRFVGEGYGHPTEAMREAIFLTASLEGLLLDPTYTGKAMSGLISMARAAKIPRAAPVLFLHTGGVPGLFAQPELFESLPTPRGADISDDSSSNFQAEPEKIESTEVQPASSNGKKPTRRRRTKKPLEDAGERGPSDPTVD
ncbi:MAG TPA: D-cysteine desulfhydrase family protein, partial [Rhodocyclaceae bacterium]|nr:D-cysteine desulfhydrase family protein [Rhodocyclaceae bacterium]